ncbi:caspase family protein [Chryseolinea sp. T2]|uniref:caspase family protein n=1 Tax=Chryseolinea sp. T2 TaxID=3129255 RepID=UPI0030769271
MSSDGVPQASPMITGFISDHSALIQSRHPSAIAMSFVRSILMLLCLLYASVATAQFKLYEKGHDAYTSGKYTEAIKNFSEYLTKGTRDKALDVDVFYLRALSYYKTNQYKEAIGDFQETLLLDHQNKGNIYWFMAKAYDKTNSLTESLNAYNYAVRDLGDNKESKAKLLWERSQLHLKMNNLPMAYLDLKTLTALQPNHADAKREIEKLEKQGIKAPVTTSPPVAQNNEKQADDKARSAEAGTTESGKTGTAKSETGKKELSPAATSGAVGSQVAGANSAKPGTATADNATPGNATPTQAVETKAILPTIAELYKDEKRFALVIGNANYPKNIGVLKNPVNDATDFAKELQSSGFEVQLLTDATYGQMRAAMLRFKEKVDAGEKDKTVSLFYYAGHGVQRDDENYLVPVDAIVEFEDDIQRYCFPVQRMVLANMERSNSRMNIVILDACRNNPFPALNRSMGEDGLGEMRRARGSFIAYATAPGSVASDGTGRNGLYTQELIKAVKKPGLTIEQVFKDVRQSVLRLSSNKQNTWDSSNIIGEFYFKFPQ